jgi:ribosome-binding factor A
MKTPPKKKKPGPGARGVLAGASQRQLRAGELIRHALAEVFRDKELENEVMVGVSVTVTQVRLSPDLRHAYVFVESLGGVRPDEVVKALNRHAKYIRGRLGQGIESKFTPDLKFVRDQSFEAAEKIASLFDNPHVRQDLEAPVTPRREDSDDGA